MSTGWAMVAGGAFFIAVKETYEVVELLEWSGWVFAALLVLMLALCAGNTVFRVRRAHHLLVRREGAGSDATRPDPS